MIIIINSGYSFGKMTVHTLFVHYYNNTITYPRKYHSARQIAID